MGAAQLQHTPEDILAIKLSLPDQLARLKQASLAHPMPTLAERRAQLTKLKQTLLAYKGRAVQSAGSGLWPAQQLRQPDRRCAAYHHADQLHPETAQALDAASPPPHRPAAGRRVEVHFQPLGVVGIIVPWNFPVMLSLGPHHRHRGGQRGDAETLEFTPHTNAVLRTMLTSVFDRHEIAIIEGDAQMAAAFSSLPFDRTLFTGSTMVGKLVMAAATPSSPRSPLSWVAKPLPHRPRYAGGHRGRADDLRREPQRRADLRRPRLRAAAPRRGC